LTDNGRSQHCALLMHRITTGGRVLRPQTTPEKDQNPFHQLAQYSALWVPQKTNVKTAKQCFLLTWIGFKGWDCNVGLCSDPCLRVFHTKLQFSDQHLTGKIRLHDCKYHFSLCG